MQRIFLLLTLSALVAGLYERRVSKSIKQILLDFIPVRMLDRQLLKSCQKLSETKHNSYEQRVILLLQSQRVNIYHPDLRQILSQVAVGNEIIKNLVSEYEELVTRVAENSDDNLSKDVAQNFNQFELDILPGVILDSMFVCKCKTKGGDEDAQKWFMSGRVNPRARFSGGLRNAAIYDNRGIVKMLLEDGRANPRAMNDDAAKFGGSAEVVTMLVEKAGAPSMYINRTHHKVF